MKYLNTTFYITILATLLLVGMFAVSLPVAQAANLEVDFQTDPLFSADNFLPGDEVTGEVTVTNNSGESQNVIVEATNVVDDDGFGDKLWLTITYNPTIYNDNFGTFLANGEVLLSTLLAGDSETYTFTVSFIDDSDNTYQGKSLGFDLCVGFEGGETNCGDTVVGGEGDFTESDGGEGGDEGSGSGSGEGSGGATVPGSGGGGGGSRGPLVITSESGTVIVNDTSVTITWTTNYLSTSQVVYSSSTESHTFDLNAPLYGYAHGFPIPERSNKVTNHSETLTGLSPGTTYFYRVISRASPPTISKELSFTTSGTYDSSYVPPADNTSPASQVSPSLALGGDNTGINNGINNGSSNTNTILAGGIEGGGAGLSPEDIKEEASPRTVSIEPKTAPQSAATFFGFPQSLADWLKYIITVILIIIIIYIILLRRRRQQNLN